MRKARFYGVFVFAAALLLTVTQVKAQNQTATLTGTVTDTSGAVVPGAKIVLRNVQSGTTYPTVSDQAGVYTIEEVKPGPGYTLTVTHSGFQTVTVAGIYMNVAVIRTENVKMTVGSVTQTVTVSASDQNVTLDTTDATVGNSFEVSMLNQLPVSDRDSPAALFTQQPGITNDGSATGSRVDQDRVTVDGLDVNDMATGEFGAIVANAPVDSVQEFRGVEAGDLSTAGPGGGGEYDLVTKSGTNHFHGDLFEYYRDRSMEGNTWFNNNAFPQVPRPPLIRNQFGGGIGGPVLRNKVLFYFDYDGRRDTLSNVVNQTVPLDSYRNGSITYRNTSGGVSSIDAAQVASLDPLGIGWNAGVQSIFTNRYPHSNNLNVGDGLNTGGFAFDAPYPYKENNFVSRVDWNINSKMKLEGVGHWTKTNGTQSAIQFPGDPETHPFLDNSYTWVVSHTWTITPNMINELYAGDVTEDYAFSDTYNPTGATQYQTFGGNGTGGAILTAPYPIAINAQGRTYPIPVVRDNFSWLKGTHSFTFGGDFKWPHPLDWTILNYNTPTLGLGGYTDSLAVPTGTPSLRPSNLAAGNSTALYDGAYALALGVVTANSATYYYNSQLNAIPQGTPQYHKYHYKEAEAYVNDTWKVTSNLTLTYGLQWQFFSVPYDANGIESMSQYYDNPGQKFDFNTYFGDRRQQSAAGQEGNLAIPLIEYVLGGNANHGPNYYSPQYDNFAPKIAFAFTPPGDRKTVINGGANIVYDQTVINAVQYQQSQFSYMFQASNPQDYGTTGNAYASFQSDARWGGINNPPAPPPAPVSSSPFLPYVAPTSGGLVPYGLPYGVFNELIDPQLKTPYSIGFNLGIQQQFSHGFLLSMTYDGRLGRRLLGQVDASQLIDFPDTKSGQMMSQAFANISEEVRKGLPITTQPWYEDVLTPGIGQYYGFANNTDLVAQGISTYVGRGDFADTTWELSGAGALPPNVGMAQQFAEDTFYTNQGFSSYNGLLTTLHKNMSNGLQFDLNYTWSHSIDNTSLIGNQIAFGGYGFICDELRPRECRGNSDFDISNNLTGNFMYDLPIGRGQMVASNVPAWLNELVGGWEISGIPNWHTGNPYNPGANAFVAGFSNNAAAILVPGASTADLKIHLNGGKGQPLYAFANPQKANADYTGPIGFELGSRNNLYGPGFFDLDLGAGKTFLIHESMNVEFRADAFNAFNHPNFGTPIVDITDQAGPFGEINSQSSMGNIGSNDNPLSSGEGPRVLQGSLYFKF